MPRRSDRRRRQHPGAGGRGLLHLRDQRPAARRSPGQRRSRPHARALGTGSSAIGAQPAAGCTATDARGVARPAGAACDAGAFQRATPERDHRRRRLRHPDRRDAQRHRDGERGRRGLPVRLRDDDRLRRPARPRRRSPAATRARRSPGSRRGRRTTTAWSRRRRTGRRPAPTPRSRRRPHAGGPGTGPAAARPRPTRPLPKLTALKLTPAKFTLKKGTRITFKLSEKATVAYTIERKKGKRYTKVGSFTASAAAGADKLKFSRQGRQEEADRRRLPGDPGRDRRAGQPLEEGHARPSRSSGAERLAHGGRARRDRRVEPREQLLPARPADRDRLAHARETLIEVAALRGAEAGPEQQLVVPGRERRGLLVERRCLVVAALARRSRRRGRRARRRAGASAAGASRAPGRGGPRRAGRPPAATAPSPRRRPPAPPTGARAGRRPRPRPPRARAASARAGRARRARRAKARAIAPGTVGRAMMFAWQLKPSPATSPACDMHPDPVWTATPPRESTIASWRKSTDSSLARQRRSASCAEPPSRMTSSASGPKAGSGTDCVATAPTPDSTHGTICPTENQCDCTATPTRAGGGVARDDRVRPVPHRIASVKRPRKEVRPPGSCQAAATLWRLPAGPPRPQWKLRAAILRLIAQMDNWELHQWRIRRTGE